MISPSSMGYGNPGDYAGSSSGPISSQPVNGPSNFSGQNMGSQGSYGAYGYGYGFVPQNYSSYPPSTV